MPLSLGVPFFEIVETVSPPKFVEHFPPRSGKTHALRVRRVQIPLLVSMWSPLGMLRSSPLLLVLGSGP